MRLQALLVCLFISLALVEADLPVHCLHSQVAGQWEFHLGPLKEVASGYDMKCGHKIPDDENDHLGEIRPFEHEKTIVFQLAEPNRVYKRDHAYVGYWTMVYDEGFEVRFDEHVYFAFSRYQKKNGKVVNMCDETLVGWYHTKDLKKWGCYYGKKVEAEDIPCPAKAENKALVEDHMDVAYLFGSKDNTYFNLINSLTSAEQELALVDHTVVMRSKPVIEEPEKDVEVHEKKVVAEKHPVVEKEKKHKKVKEEKEEDIVQYTATAGEEEEAVDESEKELSESNKQKQESEEGPKSKTVVSSEASPSPAPSASEVSDANSSAEEEDDDDDDADSNAEAAPVTSFLAEKEEVSETITNQIELVQRLNRVEKSWKAGVHHSFEGKSFKQLNRLAGVLSFDKPSSARKKVGVRLNAQQKRIIAALPKEFDWRNVNNVNFVPSVRHQGDCGSCYALASMQMLGSRVRIMTNNTDQVDLSVQHVISCSYYNQGCNGGYPFLVNKFAHEFELVPESCLPYSANHQISCSRTCDKNSLPRYYKAENYHYVGGNYGASNEADIMLEIYRKGPVVVSFEPAVDFMVYESGIYHNVPIEEWVLKGEKRPEWEKVDHSVLAVGWGYDHSTGEKYWIIQNSWGDNWGEKGYFRMRRGVDECAIESIAVASDPVIIENRSHSSKKSEKLEEPSLVSFLNSPDTVSVINSAFVGGSTGGISFAPEIEDKHVHKKLKRKLR